MGFTQWGKQVSIKRHNLFSNSPELFARSLVEDNLLDESSVYDIAMDIRRQISKNIHHLMDSFEKSLLKEEYKKIVEIKEDSLEGKEEGEVFKRPISKKRNERNKSKGRSAKKETNIIKEPKTKILFDFDRMAMDLSNPLGFKRQREVNEETEEEDEESFILPEFLINTEDSIAIYKSYFGLKTCEKKNPNLISSNKTQIIISKKVFNKLENKEGKKENLNENPKIKNSEHHDGSKTEDEEKNLEV